MELAKHIATWSKDPSTQVGAVIVDKNNRVVSLGFNGLPKGVHDTPKRLNDRELKHKIIIHAERNAIIFSRRSLNGCTIYTWPFSPCATCAGMIIQSGITRVVSPQCSPDLKERWGKDLKLAKQLFSEAGVKVDDYYRLKGDLEVKIC